MKKTLLAALAFAAIGAASFSANAGTYDNDGPYVGLNYNSVRLANSASVILVSAPTPAITQAPHSWSALVWNIHSIVIGRRVA